MSPTPAPRPEPDDETTRTADGPDTDRAPSPGPPVDRRGAFARGLFHAGLLAALGATAWQEWGADGSSPVAPLPPFGVILVLYGVLVFFVLFLEHSGSSRFPWARYVAAAVVTTAMAVLFLPLEAFAWTAASELSGVHRPSVARPVFWVGSCAAAVGSWIMVFRRPTGAAPARSWSAGAQVLGAAALVPVLLVVSAASFHRPVVHHTASAPGAAPPTPTGVESMAWEWTPDRGSVWEVLTGTHGPILRLVDGLVALDGSDGRELWSARFPGQFEDGTGIFEGGRWAYDVRGRSGGDARVRVIDTATGEFVIDGAPFAEENAFVDGATERFLLPSERPGELFMVSGEEGGGAERSTSWVTVTDTRTGEDLWTRESGVSDEGLCHFGEEHLFRDDVLWVARMCADPAYFDGDDVEGSVRIGFSGLDPLTGETLHEHLWEHEDQDEPWERFGFRVSGAWEDGDDILLTVQDGMGSFLVADLRTGEGGFVQGDLPDTRENVLWEVDREELVYTGRKPLGDFEVNGPDVVFSRLPVDPGPAVTIDAAVPFPHPEGGRNEASHAMVAGPTGLVVWPSPSGGEGEWELHAVPLDEPQGEATTVLTGTGTFRGGVVAPGAVVLAFSDRVIGVR
ncbi:hypothetical protein [Nocardiopsis sp. MG754419]|uniref:hypothetical protein n=1 Tax=Nocardiopsis sp. MG754419 TaxID=2259865 RepID=UPI001BA76E91|nr:hypothetical protein [Nocardiopsis sp. MG754419]